MFYKISVDTYSTVERLPDAKGLVRSTGAERSAKQQELLLNNIQKFTAHQKLLTTAAFSKFAP